MIQYSLKKISEIVSGKLIGDPEVTINGVAIDSRVVKPGQLFAPIIGEKVDGHSFVRELLEKGIAASFWQQDDPLDKPEGNLIVVKDVVAAMQLLAIHYRQGLKMKFVGITGSSGKTSTKDIVASVLSAKFRVYKTLGNQNNDIGVPLTIMNIDENVDICVAEMGLNDFGVMDRLVNMVQPHLTVVTSIGPAHIAQFKTIDHIVEQKCLINRDLPSDGCCFYNHEAYGLEEQLKRMGLAGRSKSYGFSASDIQATDYHLNDFGTNFNCDGITYSIPVLGQHQVLNALAGIGVGRYFGMTSEEIQQGLSAVKLTAHRLQLRNINGAIIIDDTYNANPSSVAASLGTVVQYNRSYHKTVVLGDMLELGETSYQLHYGLGDAVDFRQFDHIVLIGSEMQALGDNLAGKQIPFVHFDTNEQAKTSIQKYLEKGNVIFFKASNGMHFSQLIDSLED